MVSKLLLSGCAALILVGCGGVSPTASTGTNASSHRAGVAAAFKYSACMRQHGVPNFPDPIVNSTPGHTSVGLRVTPRETGSPSFNGAQKACQGILPMPSPAEIAKQQRQELQGKLSFARCMRRHSLNDFPDPDSHGQFSPSVVSAAGIDIHSPALLAAADACASSSGGTISKADIQRATSAGP
jgi:hypothetical protein